MAITDILSAKDIESALSSCQGKEWSLRSQKIRIIFMSSDNMPVIFPSDSFPVRSLSSYITVQPLEFRKPHKWLFGG